PVAATGGEGLAAALGRVLHRVDGPGVPAASRPDRARHEARPDRRPGRLLEPGDASVGTGCGIRPAAEPGLRLPVPDGPVPPPRWAGRVAGVGRAAAVVVIGPRGRFPRHGSPRRRAGDRAGVDAAAGRARLRADAANPGLTGRDLGRGLAV